MKFSLSEMNLKQQSYVFCKKKLIMTVWRVSYTFHRLLTDFLKAPARDEKRRLEKCDICHPGSGSCQSCNLRLFGWWQSCLGKCQKDFSPKSAITWVCHSSFVTSQGLASADQEQILGNVWDFRSMVKMIEKSVRKKPHENVSKKMWQVAIGIMP